MLMLTGLTVQIWAKTALWRSFGVVPAIHRVKTGGPYGLIRHPMYTGYTLTHVGFIVGSPSLWNALLYTVTFAIQVARLLREEHFLTREPVYRDYAARVRYRLLPGLF
jgi:protein-S-isoprenylcysteine O-methyltransferase Ste14